LDGCAKNGNLDHPTQARPGKFKSNREKQQNSPDFSQFINSGPLKSKDFAEDYPGNNITDNWGQLEAFGSYSPNQSCQQD
jgi:hypothetical protein